MRLNTILDTSIQSQTGRSSEGHGQICQVDDIADAFLTDNRVLSPHFTPCIHPLLSKLDPLPHPKSPMNGEDFCFFYIAFASHQIELAIPSFRSLAVRI